MPAGFFGCFGFGGRLGVLSPIDVTSRVGARRIRASRWLEAYRNVALALDARDPSAVSRTPFPSTAADGLTSGTLAIRNEVTSPSSPASSGTSSATWSAIGLASVLMRMISAWISGG